MNAFDVIIIGFGKGGKTLAAEFAKRGRKVAIVERSDKMYGGTCINIVNPEKPDVPLNKNDAFQKVQKRRVQEKR